MKKIWIAVGLCALLIAAPAALFAFPTVYPTGTTIYKPDKCQSGYTVYATEMEGEGSVLIDMNGNVVRQWKDMSNLDHPVKILKGGYIMGSTREKIEHTGREWKNPESTDLSIMDWNGKIVWSFPKAGMHHDFQLPGNPVGYWVPGMPMTFNTDRVLILSHKMVNNKKLTDKLIEDDYLVEVDTKGKILWDYLYSDGFSEMAFTEQDKNTLYKHPNLEATRVVGVQGGDWTHINCASYLGPNKWYDEDPVKYAMFNPENIISDGRQTNTIQIIDKKTKKLVYQIGPYYAPDTVWTFAGRQYKNAYKNLDWLIGLHHTHMIPKGLPGEGNLLIYDNGGRAGYGAPNPGSPTGMNNAIRETSRVIEIDPTTLRILWEFSGRTYGYRDEDKIFSSYVSSAQRLPNGNTLITHGAVGQLMEVTPDLEIVWEYISPYFVDTGKFNLVYRAYRVPYAYIPQLQKPVETAVLPPDNSKLRIKDISVK